jgi:hypothetical protein
VVAGVVAGAGGLALAGSAGGKPPAGVEMIESFPLTTLSVPKSVPLVPKPAYELGNAVKLGAGVAAGNGVGVGGGVTGFGAAGATAPAAVVVFGPLSGARPDMLLSYP